LLLVQKSRARPLNNFGKTVSRVWHIIGIRKAISAGLELPRKARCRGGLSMGDMGCAPAITAKDKQAEQRP
jgi:hypothetical protein